MLTCTTCGRESAEDDDYCSACGTSLAPAMTTHEIRKTVTVLFCDLTGSTELGETLDPERLRAVLASYFERMKKIVEHHGGSVEKFIGDAVMAVFGIPVLHEDDAVRAVRAAVEMRDALPALGLRGRIGVTTGEVVTGTEERLATGDAVNVAARLEQAARPGEVLIGQSTFTLVRDASDVEPIEPLALKGKSQPVPAYRLLQVHDVPQRRQDGLFVGRERELAVLGEAWAGVQSQLSCELVTITGEAGVGKSRLVGELMASIEATVVRGRCVPYGEGVTYWPVVEVLRQLDLPAADDAAGAAIRSLLGEAGVRGATSTEEIAWAFRKTLEHAASERPLLVVFDDIQWGEETFLDLVEHVALLSSGAPILLVCMARPELTEGRPTWPVTLRLEPLDAEEVDELIPEGMPGALRDRIARAAGGNPLFIEEMLAMTGEADEEVIVPLTLKALVASRLDQLERAERTMLECAAIEGEIFHLGAVQALAPEETQVTPRLAALVRKEVIRPDTPLLEAQDGFRFRHILIRDAAYEAMPKATRAELHERFASWLAEHGTELAELDEILGYHLELARDYLGELGPITDAAEGIAVRAAGHLGASGVRAAERGDLAAAENLFGRANDLLPAGHVDRPRILYELAKSLSLGGGDPSVASRFAEEAMEEAAASGEISLEWLSRILRNSMRQLADPHEKSSEAIRQELNEAVRVFDRLGDEAALAIAWTALCDIEWGPCMFEVAADAAERAAGHARRAGDRRLLADALGAAARCPGPGHRPTPAGPGDCADRQRGGAGIRIVRTDGPAVRRESGSDARRLR